MEVSVPFLPLHIPSKRLPYTSNSDMVLSGYITPFSLTSMGGPFSPDPGVKRPTSFLFLLSPWQPILQLVWHSFVLFFKSPYPYHYFPSNRVLISINIFGEPGLLIVRENLSLPFLNYWKNLKNDCFSLLILIFFVARQLMSKLLYFI